MYQSVLISNWEYPAILKCEIPVLYHCHAQVSLMGEICHVLDHRVRENT